VEYLEYIYTGKTLYFPFVVFIPWQQRQTTDSTGCLSWFYYFILFLEKQYTITSSPWISFSPLKANPKLWYSWIAFWLFWYTIRKPFLQWYSWF